MTDLFIDWDYYNSGHECPREYNVWATLSMVAAVVQRNVEMKIGGINAYEEMCFPPGLYVCLVGPQGNRKSYAKDMVRNLISNTFPDLFIPASLTSREDILKKLSEDASARVLIRADGTQEECHPIYLIVNELVVFISVDPLKMISMLVDISDRKMYDYSFKGKDAGSGIIINPIVNILACATTEYIVDQIKANLLKGGISRRMIFINNYTGYNPNPEPAIPTGGKEARERVTAHLKKLKDIVGIFEFDTPETKQFYNEWYIKANKQGKQMDSVISGFFSSIHIQVLKVAMLYTLGSYTIDQSKLKITTPILQGAIDTVMSVLPGTLKLFGASGRNELAGGMLKVMELLEKRGGMVAEKELYRYLTTELTPFEQDQCLNFMKTKTQEIKLADVTDRNGVTRKMYMTMEKFFEMTKVKQ